MVYEWVPVEFDGMGDGQPRRFTIADGASISIGTLCALSTPRTAAAAVSGNTVFAGVAREEHEPNTGVTSISLWTDGIFRVVASAAVVAGERVVGEYNCVKPAAAGGASGATELGYALEAISGGATGSVRLLL